MLHNHLNKKRMVDTEILSILRERFEDCMIYESPDTEKCKPLYKQYEDATTNWFMKCKYDEIYLCFICMSLIYQNCLMMTPNC